MISSVNQEEPVGAAPSVPPPVGAEPMEEDKELRAAKPRPAAWRAGCRQSYGRNGREIQSHCYLVSLWGLPAEMEYTFPGSLALCGLII
eukprot:4890462-Amphidinium_carterae.1